MTPLDTPAVYVFSFRENINTLTQHLAAIPSGSLAVIGKGTEEQKALCHKRGVTLLCLLEKEEYLKQNGVETAQGVLAELIQRTDTVLEDLTVLVMGYGNCGSAIASLLWLCGCEVFVHARQKGLSKAEQDGFNLFYANGDPAPFDVIINTVPGDVFPDEFLDRISPDTMIFQVASGLSGREIGDFLRRGLFFLPLPGLPGRFSPQTEAELIGDLIARELQRKRET